MSSTSASISRSRSNGRWLPRRIEVAPLAAAPSAAARDDRRADLRARIASRRRRSRRSPWPGAASASSNQRSKALSNNRGGDVFGRDLEHRIDARLDRALAQQIGAERMDRADARLFELRRARRSSRARSASSRIGSLARALDFGAQPQLEFARGFLGEGHRDDSVKLARARARSPRRSG